MKRIVSLAVATAVLSVGAASAAVPAAAATKPARSVKTTAVGPTMKWAAPLEPVVEESTATGQAQVVQTRSRRLPVYALSVEGSGLTALSCHEVSTSADGQTWTVLGQATTSDTGVLSFGKRVASPVEVAVVVAECAGDTVLTGGPLTLR